MSARKELYSFAMKGKEHSPDNSDRMSALIDAFAHELAEKIRIAYPNKFSRENAVADLIDPESADGAGT